MSQQNKTKEELSDEILLLKKRVVELETLNAEREQAEALLRSRERRFEQLLENSFDNIVVLDADGIQRYVSRSVLRTLGFQPAELLNISVMEQMIHPDDQQRVKEAFLNILNGRQEGAIEYRHRHKNGGWVDLETWGTNQLSNPDVKGVVINCRVVTERKREDAALEKRVLALTLPLESPETITVEDMFDLKDLQRLQDDFSRATGVASVITHPDGVPITAPSGFCRLCSDIIRKTEKGCANCYRSDAILGCFNPDGPTIQPCMSGGLWDAGAGIEVGGRHIANWLIGQVRDATQSEEKIRSYAREIGADENEAVKAFYEVPAMSRVQFGHVAKAVYTLSRELSTFAYQNVQQARFIAERRQAEEALRKSEERYRELVVDLEAGVVVHAPDTSIIMNNARALELLGLSEDQIKGRLAIDPEWRFLHEDHTPLLPKEYPVNKIIAEKKSIKDNCLGIMRPNKSDVVWTSVNGIPVFNEHGKISEVIISFIDLTERKQAEESLKGAVQRFELAASAAGAGVWDWDLLTGGMVWDDRMLKLYGETRGSFVATVEAWKNGLHPDDVVQAIKECEAALRGEQPFNTEFRLLLKNGTVKYIKADGLVIRDNEGRPIRMIGLNIDITERKRVEMLLRDEQKRMNTILDTVGDPIFVKDSEFRFVLANRAFYEMLGLKEKDVIGNTLAKDLPADEMKHFFEIDQRVLDTGKADLREEPLTVKDGRTLTILTRKACLVDDSGKKYVVGAIHDITDIRKAEEILQKAKKGAEEANKAKGEFLNNIAHDFRTPMQAIMGFSSLFQSEDLTTKQKRYADIISEKSKGLLVLIEELLDVSRLEAGRVQLRSIAFDLKESVERAVELAKGDLADKDVKVACSIDEDIPLLKGDEVRLNQVLTNLLSNATKYTDHGEIAVRVSLEQGDCPESKCRLRVSVKDTGLGIPKDKQGLIFDAYTRFQEFNGNKERGGVGLGLYITKTLIDLMGGTISVVSEVGAGSEFIVTLELDKA